MTVTEEFKTNIYKDYYKKVFGFIFGKTSNHTLAEDLTSEVFLKVYEKLDSFDDTKASLSTWIYTITRNKLTDYFRSRRVMEEIPETLDDGSSLEDDVCDKEELETLADALEKLDERERDIIILHYYSGKTLKEIADALDISYSYIKILHNKALSTMKKFF